MKNLVILNPASRNGKALELKEKLEEILVSAGLDYVLHISKSAEDIREIISKNIDVFDNFISCGGDGTVHNIANCLAGTGKNLGCIPLGSGNDIARNLGIPLEIDKAAAIINDGNTRKLDMGMINGKYYYLAVSGAGFDSAVTDLANNTRLPLKGTSKYTYAVYRTLITFRSKKFFIKFDGQEKTANAMFVVVGNMSSYGGGMKIVPEADPEDGIFDVCIINRMSKMYFVKVFPSVFEGKHTSDPFVDYFKASEVEIDSEYNFSVFADGEYICKLPAKFEMAKKAISFIAPKK
ncbi:MAG: Diacylglycerol kinase [Actinobacteria bacterium ADurb.Bin346]|nr:MAG: Diacylglycerol kinase [Actinobacteria bacterium ADurb.Bin346]